MNKNCITYIMAGVFFMGLISAYFIRKIIVTPLYIDTYFEGFAPYNYKKNNVNLPASPLPSGVLELKPGKFPETVSDPLLSGDYPTKSIPPGGGLSDMTVASNYPYYPITAANSCINNNLRYWVKPDNGKCYPPDICATLYDNKDYDDCKTDMGPNELGGLRINYYNSDISLPLY